MSKLKKIRLEAGLTQAKVASMLKITQQAYANYESGRRSPDLETIKKIAQIFNVSTDYLLDRADNEFKMPSNLFPAGDLIKLPITASISAGYNSFVEVYEDEKTVIPKDMLKGYRPDEIMLMRVKGDSMYPRILEGDVVVVHRQSSVDVGDIAVVLYNGDEATLKKINYVQGEDWLELIPFNPEYKPKVVKGVDLEHCRVIGKVLSLMRDF